MFTSWLECFVLPICPYMFWLYLSHHCILLLAGKLSRGIEGFSNEKRWGKYVQVLSENKGREISQNHQHCIRLSSLIKWILMDVWVQLGSSTYCTELEVEKILRGGASWRIYPRSGATWRITYLRSGSTWRISYLRSGATGGKLIWEVATPGG